MVKLSTKQQKRIEEAPEVAIGFEAWPKGKYIGTLMEVEEREGKDTGNKYWSAEFGDFTDLEGEKFSGRQWYSPIMLPIEKMPKDYLPAAMKKKGLDPKNLTEEEEAEREVGWENYQNMTAQRIKDFFAAFGFSADSDTDEVIGEQCVLDIGQETQQQGRNAGKIVNRVLGIAHLSTVGIGGTPGDTDF